MRIGTTLAAIFAVKGRVICVGLGDTRVYHYSNGILEQASFDHTHAQGMVDAREIGMNEAGTVPNAKRLTKHLGIFPDEATLSPNISVIDDVENGDVFLICSDGLSDYIVKSEIEEILSMPMPMMKRLEEMVKRSLNKGCRDNISVVAVTYMP